MCDTKLKNRPALILCPVVSHAVVSHMCELGLLYVTAIFQGKKEVSGQRIWEKRPGFVFFVVNQKTKM